MDLEQHLNHLESHRDWQGAVEALEQAIASSSDAAVKAELHLRLGRILHQKFLQGVKALKHFQDEINAGVNSMVAATFKAASSKARCPELLLMAKHHYNQPKPAKRLSPKRLLHWQYLLM